MFLAFSDHKRCFICGRLYGLHIVKKESIKHILKKFNIFVKYGTRCCVLHLNDAKLVVKDFDLIRTKNVSQKVTLSSDILSYILECEDKFQPFKNFDMLEDKYCLK